MAKTENVGKSIGKVIVFPPEMLKELATLGKEKGLTGNSVVRLAVAEFLQRERMLR